MPNGATVERMVPTTLGTTESLVLNLNSPDFTTAARLTESINASLGAGTAESIDAISVRVRAPAGESDRVAYLSHIENLEVEPAAARGQGHRQLAHRHGRHRRQRARDAGRRRARLAGRPHHGDGAREPAERVRPTATPSSSASRTSTSKQGDSRMFVFEPGTSLNDIVEAVNQVGAAPGDLVAILEALREAGALRAQLIVI